MRERRQLLGGGYGVIRGCVEDFLEDSATPSAQESCEFAQSKFTYFEQSGLASTYPDILPVYSGWAVCVPSSSPSDVTKLKNSDTCNALDGNEMLTIKGWQNYSERNEK